MDEKELHAAIDNCLAMVTATRYGQGREAKEWALAAAVLIDKAKEWALAAAVLIDKARGIGTTPG